MVSPSKLSSSSLMHFSILHCWRDFSWLPPKLCCHHSLDGLHAFKMGPLELGENKKKKFTQIKIRWIGRFVPVWWSSSQPGTGQCTGCFEQLHCRGEAAMICPATTLVSCALTIANTAGSLCQLADWFCPCCKNALWLMLLTSKNG